MEKPISFQGNPLNNTEIYEALFLLIDNVLFRFKNTSNETEEDLITQNIEMFLTEEAHITDEIFSFQNQYKEGIYTTDIGVYLRSNYNCFCWIEAKILPTPNRKKDRDEREYVFVDKKINKYKGNGGIQRFKECKHAKNLSHSIMFGYIQDNNSVDHWLKKINNWIVELVIESIELWSREDCLTKYASKKCDRFYSVHKRKNNTMINLHHYWIKV